MLTLLCISTHVTHNQSSHSTHFISASAGGFSSHPWHLGICGTVFLAVSSPIVSRRTFSGRLEVPLFGRRHSVLQIGHRNFWSGPSRMPSNEVFKHGSQKLCRQRSNLGLWYGFLHRGQATKLVTPGVVTPGGRRPLFGALPLLFFLVAEVFLGAFPFTADMSVQQVR